MFIISINIVQHSSGPADKFWSEFELWQFMKTKKNEKA